jgi:hypothetical protein
MQAKLHGAVRQRSMQDKIMNVRVTNVYCLALESFTLLGSVHSSLSALQVRRLNSRPPEQELGTLTKELASQVIVFRDIIF